MSLPPPHRLTLPDVPVNEQGMRQLEIWLEGKFGRRGGGLQYHRAKRYGAHNIGDWLDVATTSAQVNTDIPRGLENPAILLTIQTPNGATNGIVFWDHDETLDNDKQWTFGPAGLLYYLDGSDDIGYLGGGDTGTDPPGGNFYRFTPGGSTQFTQYAGDSDSGQFTVFTNADSQGGGQANGTIEFHSGTFANNGQITIEASNVSPNNGEAINIGIATGEKLQIYDGTGAPIVTYTG